MTLWDALSSLEETVKGLCSYKGQWAISFRNCLTASGLVAAGVAGALRVGRRFPIRVKTIRPQDGKELLHPPCLLPLWGSWGPARVGARSYHAQDLVVGWKVWRRSFQNNRTRQSISRRACTYLGMTAGPRAASAHRSARGQPASMPVGGQNGAYTTTTHSSLSHRAPSTEQHTGHWALGTGRPRARLVLCRQRLAPFIPISAPTLPSLGFPPPSRRGKHGQCALQVPSAHFKPQNTRLASVTRNLRGSFISPTPQLRQIKGLVATCSPNLPALSTSPAPVLSDAPLQVISNTPELDASSSVWNRPSKHLHASFVISGRAWPPGRQRSRSG